MASSKRTRRILLGSGARRLSPALFSILLAIFLWGAALAGDRACAQEITLTKPILPNGEKLHVPIDLRKTWENWTSVGAGCCAMASHANCLIHWNMEDVARTLKSVTLTETGGHSPEKLDRQMRKVLQRHPGRLYFYQWHNVPDGWERIKRATREGVPVMMTWGTGKHYGGMLIYHAVTGVHVDDNYCVILDNNYPREYACVPEKEGQRRHRMGGMAWAGYLVPVGYKGRAGANADGIVIITTVSCAAILALAAAIRSRI